MCKDFNGYEEWLDQQHDEAGYEMLLEEEYSQKLKDATMILADGISRDKESMNILGFETTVMA